MQRDVGVEAVASIRAAMSRYKKVHGNSAELEEDRRTVLDFKEKVKFDDSTTWEEILEFSKQWKAKYS